MIDHIETNSPRLTTRYLFPVLLLTIAQAIACGGSMGMEPPPPLGPPPAGLEKAYAHYERTAKLYHSRMEGDRDREVKTQEGTNEGWSFKRSCPNTWAALVVEKGTPFEDVKLTEPNPPGDPLGRLHVKMVEQLAPIQSLRWTDFGPGCNAKRAFRVQVADYRHIDEVARLMREWMMANGVSGEVIIDVCSIIQASPEVRIPKCGGI